MDSVTRLATTMIGVVSTLGSGSACTHPLPDFPSVLSRPGCTQEDLSAIEIIMTERAWDGEGPAPLPMIRIEVTGLLPGGPGLIALSPVRGQLRQRQLARAAYLAQGERAVWLAGSLQFEQASEDSDVKGHFDFCRFDGVCTTGSFVAPWKPRTVVCG